MHRLAILATIVMLSSSLTPAALAQGKGKGKNGNTSVAAYGISLVMVNDANGDSLPNWNDVVSFDVGTAVDHPFVQLNCYQGATLVLAAAYPADWTFQLASTSWSGGEGDCTATLYTTTDGRRTTTLATLAIHVDE